MVGAGVIGLAAAHYLLAAGHEVLVLERAPEGHAGTSHGNAGMVVPSHFVPLAAPGAVAQAVRWMPDPESPFRFVPRASPELVRWGLAFWRAAGARRAEAAGHILLALSRASRAAYEELEREDWIVETPRPDELFSSDPDGLWSHVLTRKGGTFALVARMPWDPSMN